MTQKFQKLKNIGINIIQLKAHYNLGIEVYQQQKKTSHYLRPPHLIDQSHN